MYALFLSKIAWPFSFAWDFSSLFTTASASGQLIIPEPCIDWMHCFRKTRQRKWWSTSLSQLGKVSGISLNNSTTSSSLRSPRFPGGFMSDWIHDSRISSWRTYMKGRAKCLRLSQTLLHSLKDKLICQRFSDMDLYGLFVVLHNRKGVVEGRFLHSWNERSGEDVTLGETK